MGQANNTARRDPADDSSTRFQRSSSISTRNLATAVRRVGKVGGHRVRLDLRLTQLAETCRQRVGAFNSQELANTAWGFAKTSVAVPQLFEAIAVEVQRRIREFNSQEVANTAWAFATAGVSALPLFETIAVEAQRRIREFRSQEIANTAWPVRDGRRLFTDALRGDRSGGVATNPRFQRAEHGHHGLGFRDGRRLGVDALRVDRCRSSEKNPRLQLTEHG
mmetsp:Transcript_8542/g.26269  ORF Transcript_8542/g.26269 Transcript_8542/m.26269 type:complete len:221 (+) Transcript_8542:576-1238(+)